MTSGVNDVIGVDAHASDHGIVTQGVGRAALGLRVMQEGVQSGGGVGLVMV